MHSGAEALWGRKASCLLARLPHAIRLYRQIDKDIKIDYAYVDVPVNPCCYCGSMAVKNRQEGS